MGNKFGLGWKKDPVDNRDYSIRKLPVKAIELPEIFTVYEDTIIYDQGQTPRCVAYASSGIKTDEEFLQWGNRYKFDADWLYAECKKIDGIPNEEGTYPRVACKILQERGTILASSNASFCSFFFKRKQNEKKADPRWKISGYYRIDSSCSDQEIKQVLFQYGSILAASNWYQNWFDRFAIFPEPNIRQSVGGHAYRIIGWNNAGWIVANSWGATSWGEGGKAIMPFDMFRKYVLPESDVWKIVDYIGE